MAIRDEDWPAARLIPISSASGVEAQERRLASALLATMKAVPEFGRALLKPHGAPAGKIDTFIEVPFKVGDKSVRPDGVITVTRGTKTWAALVETKTASNPILSEQINLYLDLARELEFEAVLSISNQFATAARDYPVEVDRRKLRRVSLHHWSWVDVLTEAIVQKEFRGSVTRIRRTSSVNSSGTSATSAPEPSLSRAWGLRGRSFVTAHGMAPCESRSPHSPRWQPDGTTSPDTSR
jgi:hypothetical protein